ncbi:hypothetical protein [Propionibacterium australiense]|uniref:hypothetical protein n=1 Tax=Propionibacterium australiense TaxID=119981 RepID=UPI0011C3B4C2|nr:hypothetical protein [Propionibacterium australiense]
MDRWRVGLVAAGLCSVLVVAGCGSGDAPGPGGSSVGSSSGPVSASPSSGSPVSSAVSPGEEELYAEAERVYRAYFELEQQAFLEGGVNGVPAEMNEYITGNYTQVLRKFLSQMSEHGWRMQPGTREQIMMLRRAPEINREDSVATLRVCTDSTNSPLVDQNGAFVSSGFALNSLFFKYDIDGKLKIYGNNGESVESCDVS